jgi:hypothetical protein
LVTIQSALRSLYRAAFIAGATAAGGPPGGATAAALLKTPAGKATIDGAVAFTLAEDDLSMASLAQGGLVMSPTLALIGEAGPELVTPVKKKRSRSARASDKKLSKAFKEANSRYRLKNGSLRKGRTQADIAKLAHKLKKKM